MKCVFAILANVIVGYRWTQLISIIGKSKQMLRGQGQLGTLTINQMLGFCEPRLLIDGNAGWRREEE